MKRSGYSSTTHWANQHTTKTERGAKTADDPQISQICVSPGEATAQQTTGKDSRKARWLPVSGMLCFHTYEPPYSQLTNKKEKVDPTQNRQLKDNAKRKRIQTGMKGGRRVRSQLQTGTSRELHFCAAAFSYVFRTKKGSLLCHTVLLQFS